MYTAIIPERMDVHPELRHGRHVEHDPRSLEYKVFQNRLQAIKGAVVRPVTSVLWKRWSPILDQGHLGSCTGNAITGLLGCEPFVTNSADAAKFNEDFAISVYEAATVIDSFPGQYPPDDTGSSGLAVSKVVQGMGLITKYSHATTSTEMIYALRSGPVIVGIPWYESFYKPSSTGLVQIGGSVVGGHEFLIRGYDASKRLFIADNSWSSTWGVKGSFNFTTATWEALRRQQADCVAPRR